MKIFGIGLLFTACVIVGFFASSFYRNRTEQLEGIKELIGFTGAQIEGYLTPAHKIFMMFSNKALQKCGFINELQKRGWEEALKACRRKLFLTDREFSELSAFFSQLGKCDTDSAVRHCNYYKKLFGELASTARTELPGKTKLCCALGFAAGVMLTVLFI